MKKSLTLTFWALMVVFLLIISEFFIPAVRDLFKGSFLFLIPLIIFSLLGLILIILTVKEKINRMLKKFLILTGVFTAGFFVSVFLHNFFYGLAVITGHITILSYLMEVLHVIFFIIAIFVCPLGFLVSAVGSIIMLIKNKNRP